MRSGPTLPCVLLLALTSLWWSAAGPARAGNLGWLEQIPLETFEEMREVERYQLSIAEKHYVSGEYKVALDEYEKFLTLYESSPGAAYSQLMWSHCQLRLRKVNAAIREGFQSVIDYWPDSREAKLAAYLIPQSYQNIGEVEKAVAAYKQLIETHSEDHIAVLAKVKILEIAKQMGDRETRLSLLEEFTFEIERTDAAKGYCVSASRELASYYFHQADWSNALKCLETTYATADLDAPIYDIARNAVAHLRRSEDTKPAGDEMADRMLKRFDESIPTQLSEGEGNAANRALARTCLGRLGGMYSLLGRQDDVLANYERIGELLGIDDGLRGQIAGFHRSNGEREKARRQYEQFDHAINGKRNIVAMVREEGKLEEAIELYRELIGLDSDAVDEYLWSIAECQEGLNDLPNAIQTYRQTDRWPSNYFRMASCQRRLKNYSEALTLYNQIKSHEGAAAEAMIQSGHTFEEAGQRENAIKTFQLTCRTHPKSSQASRAHAHLQSKYGVTVTLGGAKDE